MHVNPEDTPPEMPSTIPITASAFHRTETQIGEEWSLIQAAQRDARRFGPLYEQYYRQLFLFVYKRVGDEDDAADVTAQVFVKALQNLNRYEDKGLPFASWLYRIALNEVNQFFRNNAKRSLTISTDSGSAIQLVAEIAEAQDECADEQQLQRMYAAMQRLAPDEVQLIQMRYFDKIPFKEVADILGISENNAKVRAFRLLQKLKKYMTP